jgi:ribosome biogenesis GTPase / thiamine phosphate phosphatase
MLKKEAIVIKSTGSWYQVKTAEQQILNARLKGKIRLDDRKTTNPIAVGDRVEIEYSDENEDVNICKIFERKNYIIRKSINLSKQTQVIAANMDQAILVATIVQPRTSQGFIDRFLVTAEAYAIPAKIIFNKRDLLDENLLKIQTEIMDMYVNAGYECFSVSTLNHTGLENITNLLKDKISLVTGHSGVGKSSLVNAIDKNLDLRIGIISEAHSKGKHTTTFAEMFELSFGGSIIDTPGIKELGLIDIEKHELGHFFPEIRAVMNECKFNNCQHENEPGCAVQKAVENNTISEYRYDSYIKMLHGEDMDWKHYDLK